MREGNVDKIGGSDCKEIAVPGSGVGSGVSVGSNELQGEGRSL